MPHGLLLVSGNGTHQENYARAFAADPRCRIVGMADEADVTPRRRELNSALACELKIPELDCLENALTRPDVDLVSVCAEPERRGRIALAALRAGKHVYLDKEPAATRDEADAIAKLAREKGLRSQTFSLVRSGLAVRAKRVLDSRRLGRLIGLHAELYFAKGQAGSADTSRPRVERAEAGHLTFLDSKRELLCVGWYPLVLFQWLTGQRFRRVTALTRNYFFAAHQQNNVEDHATLMLEMESGLEVTITVGRTGWTSHPASGVNQIHLVGESGLETIDAFRPRLEISSEATVWRPPRWAHPEDPMGFWSSTTSAGDVRPKTSWIPVEPTVISDAAWFLDCLEQRRESDVNADLAARTLGVILAAYESSAEGKTVRVK